MGWIHKGGGVYENEETGERIRGKANLPVEGSPDIKLVCVPCQKETMQTPQDGNNSDWAFYFCSECGAKNKVKK